MSPPTIDQFLTEIAQFIQQHNGTKLQDYLIIEPPLPPLYNKIVSELRQAYPSANTHDALEAKVKTFIPEYEDGNDEGGSRQSLITFLVRYFAFLRDVNVDNLVETHDLLKALLNQAILALSSSAGITILPTVISFSRTLARLAIGLDKRPDLVAPLIQHKPGEAEERVTLVESSANVIREAFKKCLSERGGASDRPEGRRVGIYLSANLCLKLFFHCKKLRSAEQIFGNIYQQSPPLALFPASQRVTFLYYLGRYLFANGHFFRAQSALQEAYNQCHAQCVPQLRRILIYLITSNIILGRFPSPATWHKPEAANLQPLFEPILTAIRQGDLASFHTYLNIDSDSAHVDWFLKRRILLQLLNRGEILVWRSLARRTFLLAGSEGDASSRRAPTMALADMLTLAQHTVASSTTMEEVESVMASLVQQGLLHGFLSHSSRRFAITGAKNASPLQVGFPRVWDVVRAKADEEAPGWVKQERGRPAFAGAGGAMMGKVGPGMVVNLSGARPAGSIPA